MLLLIGFPIVGILVGLWVCHRDDFDNGWFGQVVLGIFIGFATAIATTIAVRDSAATHMVHHSHWTLHAMQSSNSVSGTFILGSGSVDSRSAYKYYYVDNDSSGTFYVERVIPAEHVKIYEEDRCDGELEVTVAVLDNPKLNLISLPSDDRYYVFRIPKGSIAQQFTM